MIDADTKDRTHAILRDIQYGKGGNKQLEHLLKENVEHPTRRRFDVKL